MGNSQDLSSHIFVGPFVHSNSLNKLEFICEGIIVVSNGKIVALESQMSNNTKNRVEQLQKDFSISSLNIYYLKAGSFLIPGFIDTHIHGPQYPNLGLGYDLTLLEWLKHYTYPLEKKFSNQTFAEEVYNAVVKKTLTNGTTTACYFATIHMTGSITFARCVNNLGQRAFIGKVNMNKNTPRDYGETYEESMASTRGFIEAINALNSPFIKPIITPRFALSCDMKLMKALGDLAAQQKLLIQTHVAENEDEVAQVHREFPNCKHYVDVYDKAGLVNEKTILSHGIYLTLDECDVIKSKKASISHCPSSNINLKSGICPVRRYLDKGINLSLGTDCSGGSSCSMLDCIRQAIFLSRAASMNEKGKPLTLHEAFYMATLGGAKALSLEHTVGNFIIGKDFDAILVNLAKNNDLDVKGYSLIDLFEKFIYLGDDRMMEKVYVAGKLIKE